MSTKMGLRKIVLLSSILVLALVFVLQQFLLAPESNREYTLKENIDRIEIQKPNEPLVVFTLQGENWLIGNKGEMAQKSAVESISSAFSSIVRLSLVSVGIDLERYSLTEDQRITVNVYSQSKKVRTVYVGKTSLSGSQTYIQLDSKKDVLLVTSNLRDMITKQESDFVEKPQEIQAENNSAVDFTNASE